MRLLSRSFLRGDQELLKWSLPGLCHSSYADPRQVMPAKSSLLHKTGRIESSSQTIERRSEKAPHPQWVSFISWHSGLKMHIFSHILYRACTVKVHLAIKVCCCAVFYPSPELLLRQGEGFKSIPTNIQQGRWAGECNQQVPSYSETQQEALGYSCTGVAATDNNYVLYIPKARRKEFESFHSKEVINIHRDKYV